MAPLPRNPLRRRKNLLLDAKQPSQTNPYKPTQGTGSLTQALGKQTSGVGTAGNPTTNVFFDDNANDPIIEKISDQILPHQDPFYKNTAADPSFFNMLNIINKRGTDKQKSLTQPIIDVFPEQGQLGMHTVLPGDEERNQVSGWVRDVWKEMQSIKRGEDIEAGRVTPSLDELTSSLKPFTSQYFGQNTQLQPAHPQETHPQNLALNPQENEKQLLQQPLAQRKENENQLLQQPLAQRNADDKAQQQNPQAKAQEDEEKKRQQFLVERSSTDGIPLPPRPISEEEWNKPIMPFTNGRKRLQDDEGHGDHRKGRENKYGYHQGSDFLIQPGKPMTLPFDIKLTRDVIAKKNDRGELHGFEGTVTHNGELYQVKVLYTKLPDDLRKRLKAGEEIDIKKGDTIGIAEDLNPIYKDSIPPHTHIEFRKITINERGKIEVGSDENPDKFLKAYDTWGSNK